MKVSVAALALLIAAFCYQTSSAPLGSDPPTSCCFSYTSRQLPRSFVKDPFQNTGMEAGPRGWEVMLHGPAPPLLTQWAWCAACPNSAGPRERLGLGQGSPPPIALPPKSYLSASHRFVTRKSREVCANPEEDWVQEYMSDLELN
nr:C-C motif chemokine 4-like [Columba livia]